MRDTLLLSGFFFLIVGILNRLERSKGVSRALRIIGIIRLTA